MSEPAKPKKNFEPLRATGLFMAVFGVAVMCAAFLEMSTVDRLINLVSGLFLFLLGMGGVILGWIRSKQK